MQLSRVRRGVQTLVASAVYALLLLVSAGVPPSVAQAAEKGCAGLEMRDIEQADSDTLG